MKTKECVVKEKGGRRNTVRRSIMIKRGVAALMSAFMIVGGLAVAPEQAAAKTVKLSAKKITLKAGKSKKLALKNISKKNAKNTTWKISNKKVAKLTVAKNKTSVTIKAKKKGTARITAIIKIKGKKKKLTCTVNVKKAAAASQNKKTDNPSSDGDKSGANKDTGKKTTETADNTDNQGTVENTDNQGTVENTDNKGNTENTDNTESTEKKDNNGNAKTDEADSKVPNTENYKLEEVVVFSRHDLRAPTSSGAKVINSATPYKWIDWTAPTSQLTTKGGLIETALGQYFRKWLEKEEFIPENYIPEDNEVRFLANSRQRTISTAQYFSSGMLPVANVEIQWNRDEFETMNPLFNPVFTYMSEDYVSASREEVAKVVEEKDLKSKLEEDYRFLTDLIDLHNSEGYKSGTITDFTTDDLSLGYVNGKEPSTSGSLKPACNIADSMVLQLYEYGDMKAGAFGKDATLSDWKKIAEIKDTYIDLLYGTPLVAKNIARPLIEELSYELSDTDRKFSFLTGHDSNIASILGALGVKDYVLPEAIEHVPIGSKIVFEKRLGADDEEYVAIRLVYASFGQLTGALPQMSLDNPPQSYYLDFDGIEKNADGLYKLSDVQQLMSDVIDAYDNFQMIYGISDPEEVSSAQTEIGNLALAA